MQDPHDFPTAADYAWNSANKAQSTADANARRLARIEAALVRLGLLEPDPEPAPVVHRPWQSNYADAIEKILAEDDAK